MAIPREMEPTVVRILLVDDDPDDHLLTKELLNEIQGGRYHLDWTNNFEEALELICRGDHDVYLLDYRLGSRTGLDLLRAAQERNCLGAAILLTGQGERAVDQAATQAGAMAYLEKMGLDSVRLERAIRYAIQQRRYEQELERKVAERTLELERANEALRAADKRKDEFLATLAHELRNPLAPIRNALEIMRLAAENPDAVVRAREMMDRQVRQMVRLIDDLLDVSRITRNKLRLTMEDVDLQSIIEATLELCRPALDKAQVRFTVDVPQKQIVLRADRVRLTQIIANLLNNAAKYTEPNGTVLLAVEQEDAHVRIRVRDSGVGIPREVLPHVFELFTQVDRTLNRAQGGLGIGLALVQRLTEMHGGTVAVHSEGVGKGAEFTIRVPLPEKKPEKECPCEEKPG